MFPHERSEGSTVNQKSLLTSCILVVNNRPFSRDHYRTCPTMALAVLHYIFKSVAVRFFKDLTEKYPGSLYIYDHLYLKRTKQLASQRKLI